MAQKERIQPSTVDLVHLVPFCLSVVVVMVEKEMVEVVGKVEVQRGEEEWMVVMLGTGSNATVQGGGVGG